MLTLRTVLILGDTHGPAVGAQQKTAGLQMTALRAGRRGWVSWTALPAQSFMYCSNQSAQAFMRVGIWMQVSSHIMLSCCTVGHDHDHDEMMVVAWRIRRLEPASRTSHRGTSETFHAHAATASALSCARACVCYESTTGVSWWCLQSTVPSVVEHSLTSSVVWVQRRRGGLKLGR
jgi:hypothetical protein